MADLGIGNPITVEDSNGKIYSAKVQRLLAGGFATVLLNLVGLSVISLKDLKEITKDGISTHYVKIA